MIILTNSSTYCDEIYRGQHNLILVGCLLVLLRIFFFSEYFSFQFSFFASLEFSFVLSIFSLHFHYLLTNASVLLSTFYAVKKMYEALQQHSYNTLNQTTVIITTTHLTRQNAFIAIVCCLCIRFYYHSVLFVDETLDVCTEKNHTLAPSTMSHTHMHKISSFPHCMVMYSPPSLSVVSTHSNWHYNCFRIDSFYLNVYKSFSHLTPISFSSKTMKNTYKRLQTFIDTHILDLCISVSHAASIYRFFIVLYSD